MKKSSSLFSAVSTAALLAPLRVGGQAVLEGVMMRSPRAMAVVVRRPDGTTAVRQDRWRSIGERFPVFKRPLLRGTVVLMEAMVNGMQALHFSAQEAAREDDGEADAGQGLPGWTLVLSMAAALAVGLGLFVVIPHLASGFILRLLGDTQGVASFAFHGVDGFIKMGLFLGYVYFIGRLPDIKRVFEYHGAEHKSIYAYESGEELTVENARLHSTVHPRCGTAFIMVVFLVSIGLFALVIPFLPHVYPAWLNTPVVIMAKIGLMVPVAGMSYEIIRWSDKRKGTLVGVLLAPGLLMQRATTRPPSDDQLEIAIEALKRALDIESNVN